MKWNKKGQFFETIDFGKELFFFVMVIIVIVIILTKIDINFQALDVVPDFVKTLFSEARTNLTTAFDWMFILLFLGSLIISMIQVNKMQFSTQAKVVSLIFVFLLVFMLAILSNAYQTGKIQNADFLAAAGDLPIVDFLMRYLVEFGIFYFGVLAYMIYTKKGAEG